MSGEARKAASNRESPLRGRPVEHDMARTFKEAEAARGRLAPRTALLIPCKEADA
jgi:hypothetical protein